MDRVDAENLILGTAGLTLPAAMQHLFRTSKRNDVLRALKHSISLIWSFLEPEGLDEAVPGEGPTVYPPSNIDNSFSSGTLPMEIIGNYLLKWPMFAPHDERGNAISGNMNTAAVVSTIQTALSGIGGEWA